MNLDIWTKTFLDHGRHVPKDLAYFALAMLMLVIATLIKRVTVRYRVKEELTDRDNNAVGASVAGYYAATLIVCAGPLFTQGVNPSQVWWVDWLITAGYCLLGIVLLNVSRFVVDYGLLHEFSTTKEIIVDANVGTGVVEMGAYIASGLVIASSLQGQGGGPHTTLVFYALGQVSLLLYGRLYRKMCRYNLHDEIEKDNVAAGAALGFNLVAMGIVLLKASSGNFQNWSQSLSQFAVITAFGTILLVVIRLLIEYVLFPGVNLHREIAEDRNLNAAWLEGAILTGMAGLAVSIL
jgi:uncharacterized membrane protein YjfL (UPF0719 family)